MAEGTTHHPRGAITSNIVTRVLSELEHQKDVAKSEFGSKGESNDASTRVPKGNKEDDQLANKPIEQLPVQSSKEKVLSNKLSSKGLSKSSCP